MKTIIVTVLLVASVNCQSPAFESFMSRNRELFSNLSPISSQSFGQQQQQQLPQWQQFQGRQSSPSPAPSFARSLAPSGSPFVTSNSHIQTFNPQQSTGSPTTISGPNFQTSINLPAIPALPQHPAGSPAALAHQQHQHHQHQHQLQLQQQQQQQSQPQPRPQFQQFQPQAQSQSQPQLTHQFTTHVHNHQIPSSQLANQPSSGSFFNSQGNTNFPFNFQQSQTPTQSAPLNFPTPPNVQQSFGSLGFSAFQGANNNFLGNQAQAQPQPQAQQSSFGLPSTTIRAPGFETTFVFMRPSEQPAQGASLSKVIRDPSGIERQMFYVPMPNYNPPSVFTTQIVHSNPQQQQQQQQGQQQ